MKSIIQHNFTSGLGDCIVAIYEYIDTAEELINLGYTVELILNIDKNCYIYNDDFFNLFNKDEFTIFSKIEFTSTPITTIIYNEYTRVYSLRSASPGAHWWDLFVDDPELFDMNIIKIYPYKSNVLPKKRNIINDELIKEYQNISPKKPFVSIYYRSFDLRDGDNYLQSQKENIDKALKLNDNIFVCSNSFNFKKPIKDLNLENIMMYDIPEESNYGNHWYGHKLKFNENDILFERTKYTIFDMLTLSDSSFIHHFTEWGRTSNFLIFSKINKVNIVSYL
jgi:hypothetical protein